MSERVIIHFQEGFAGEAVELWQGRKRLGEWPMRTRLQTGVAHIESLELKPGTELRLAMPATGVKASLKAPQTGGAHVFLVNFDGQELRITEAEDEPGYL